MNGEICAVDTCERVAQSLGWCPPHYKRWRRNGDAGDAQIKVKASPQPPRPCKVADCEKTARSRGWCNTHYERWRLDRDVDAPGDLRHGDPNARCTIENCYDPPSGRGWCAKHYARWQRQGDPEKTVRNYGTFRSILNNGYVRVWCPDHPAAQSDGYALEHRKVVIDAGIDIPEGFQVHHRNHNRTDNRIENLEVLSVADHAAQHGLGCNQFGHAEGCRYGAAGWKDRL